MDLPTYEKQIVDCLAEGDLNCWALGLAGESGEVIELIKKLHYHNGVDKNGPITRDRILKECGDVVWYLTALLHEFDYSLQDCIDANAAKLLKRHPNGWTFATAQNHADEKP